MRSEGEERAAKRGGRGRRGEILYHMRLIGWYRERGKGGIENPERRIV
jgi:hypothetical protein